MAELAPPEAVLGEAPSVAPKPTAPVPPRSAPSPVLREVLRLLRSPKSAAVAVTLREILGPPLSRR